MNEMSLSKVELQAFLCSERATDIWIACSHLLPVNQVKEEEKEKNLFSLFFQTRVRHSVSMSVIQKMLRATFQRLITDTWLY